MRGWKCETDQHRRMMPLLVAYWRAEIDTIGYSIPGWYRAINASIYNWRNHRQHSQSYTSAVTVTLIIVSFPSPTLSFIPDSKPSFSANPSHCSLYFSSSGQTT